MRILLSLLSILFVCSMANAQIGLNGGLKKMNTPSWDKFFEKESFLDNGFKVGVDYWFRLKNKRVEFTPEISYAQFKSTVMHFTSELAQDFGLQLIGLHFNTNLYLLDFANDCNCPTFDKDGDIFKKGLFIQISPGISYMNAKYEVPQDKRNTSQAVPSLGIGLGLDIGITNFITITPIINYQLYFNAAWDGLAEIAADGRIPDEEASEKTDMRQFFAGLKFTFRFDELNKYGYR